MCNIENENKDSSHPSIPQNEMSQHRPPENIAFRIPLHLDPRFQDNSVPEAYRTHPLILNRYFYTIPEQLLQKIVLESDEHNEEMLQMEIVLSKLSGDHGFRVGFWNDTPIMCNLLRTTPLIPENMEQAESLNGIQINESLAEINKRLLSFSEICCGYSGWLMTNPLFLSELAVLTSELHEQINEWGTEMVGLPIPSSQPFGRTNPTNNEGWQEYDSTMLEFCIRWRLQGLVGPRIPIPMQPMMSGTFPLIIVKQLMRAGGVFNWPDTFPLFARDELRDLLASALQLTGSTEHLEEWHSIIAPSNRAKNQIATFERYFRFRHFWLLLRERHPEVFGQRLTRIAQSFADYMGVEVSTISKMRNEIKTKLGDNWDQSEG